MRARFILVVLAAALAGPALAQDQCQRYRAELASLGDGGQEARAAVQLAIRYRAIGCENSSFLFFDTRPAECPGLAQRIRSLQAESGDVSARRRAIAGAAARACASPMRAKAPEGERFAQGGGQVICVRTCDGGFFPMDNLPDGREGADQLCRALCPGTEAVAYSMPHGDDALSSAAAIRDRRAYKALPNAFKFRTAHVEGCSCRPEGQSWSQTLARAERMLDRHEGDLIVTVARAEALSRPGIARAAIAKRKVSGPAEAVAASSARPVTPATATLAARGNGADAAPTPAEIEARAETTGSVASPAKPAIRVISTNRP